MIGVVLCGGQSKRMGADKGLLKFHDRTWVEIAKDKLQALSLPVRISINTNQLAGYSKICSPEELIADNSSLKIMGPLCGILSVHIEYSSEDLLLLACDMPLMQTEILKELVEQHNHQPHTDAFVFTNDGEPEPLCGIYKAKGLAHIHHLYKRGRLANHSMKCVLEDISTSFIPLPDGKKKFFSNVNTRGGLTGL